MKLSKIAQVILFFLSGPKPSAPDRKQAVALSEATGKRVSFRNAGLVGADERPERCIGCFGNKALPAQYAETLPVYSIDGEHTEPQEPVAEPSGPPNALGLPAGCPDTKEGLQAALAGAGVPFHPNTGQEKLVALFVAQILEAEPDNG